MDFVSHLIAQAQSQQPDMLTSLLPFVLLFAAMYFLIIAPQRKKQKQHQKMVEELKSGTDILTTGGIYGTVTNVKDDRFVVKIAENTKIEIAKSAVGSVIAKSESE